MYGLRVYFLKRINKIHLQRKYSVNKNSRPLSEAYKVTYYNNTVIFYKINMLVIITSKETVHEKLQRVVSKGADRAVSEPAKWTLFGQL